MFAVDIILLYYWNTFFIYFYNNLFKTSITNVLKCYYNIYISLEYVIVGNGLDIQTLKDIIKNGYHNPQSLNINRYEIDPLLSDGKVQVYHHPNKSHVVINHSGTNDYMDMLTDLMLVNGYKENTRFQHSKTVTEKAKQKYGADK